MVLDRLAAARGLTWRSERAWKCHLATEGELLLCKPMTYMNLSGEAVRAVCDFRKITPAEIVVISDDLALPIGKLRLRAGGSAGGHNGLRSITAQLGTLEYPRLRIGIGEADRGGTVDYVLGRFGSEEERTAFETGLVKAGEAVQTIRERGFAAAMNAFN